MINRMTQQYLSKFWPAVVLSASVAAWTTIGGAPAIAQDSQAQPTQDSAQTGQRTDGQIEMDVVHALDAAQSLQQDWITAGTVQGEVTLSGTSASDANRQLAESITSKVPGVTKVVNNLKVGDPQQAQANDTPDTQGQYSDPTPQVATNGNTPQQPQAPEQPQSNQPNYPSNYPPPPQPGTRPDYRPAPYPPQYAQVPEHPQGPVTIPQGTLLKVRTSEPLDNKKAKDGTPVEFTVARDVYAGGVLAIPRGATILGVVTNSKNAGRLGGSAELALNLQSLQLEGKGYDLNTNPFEVKGPNKAGRTAGNAIGGALFGAIIGGAVGGGEGAAIGAGAGAAGGTAVSAATPGPRVWIPSEAMMDFHLNTDLTVTPVSRQEAMRLAANQPDPAQRPTLYRRGPYRYGYPPPPPPPGYYPY